jgi:putative transposase
MIINRFRSRAPISELCGWLSLPESVYHYKPGTGKRGARPSVYTLRSDGTRVDNAQVLEDIRSTLTTEFCCYGYRNVTSVLRDKDYLINHKKVYRLMDESKLLLGKVISSSGSRKFVEHRKIKASRPMEYLCLDIKYVWVAGEKRNYYLLSIQDVFTRMILRQVLKGSIRKYDVIDLFRSINLQYGISGVRIRNDNGSQFIANDVKRYLKEMEALQEFTHIATPEENAYIEAFHSIVQREVIKRHEFSSFYEAKTTFQRHLQWYNHERKHCAIGRITPAEKWNQYEKEKAITGIILALRGEVETGAAGEHPVRNNPANEDDRAGALKGVPSLQTSSLLPLT